MRVAETALSLVQIGPSAPSFLFRNQGNHKKEITIQTFLPYEDFEKSARTLDRKRLGKQRVEAKQIIKNLTTRRDSWYNHPAVQMWKDHVEALKLYYNAISKDWVRRGYEHNMGFYDVDETEVEYPPWLGDEKFHSAHRSNLLRKEPEYYSQFGWDVPDDLPYIWPIQKCEGEE